MFGFSGEYDDLHLFIRHWTEPQRFYMSCFPRRFPFFFFWHNIYWSHGIQLHLLWQPHPSLLLSNDNFAFKLPDSPGVYHCRLLFSSAGHSSPGFLSHLFPSFEVLSWSASGRVRRVVCVRRNGEYGREEFSISCRKFLINFVKSVLSVFPSITEGRNTVHHRQERMLLF